MRVKVDLVSAHVRILERMAEDEGVTVQDIVLRALTEHLSSLSRFDQHRDDTTNWSDRDWDEWMSRESVTIVVPADQAEEMDRLSPIRGYRKKTRLTHGERVARAVDYFLLM